MNDKDTAQLKLLETYLSDQESQRRQQEKHLPTEVRDWLTSADAILGNDPKKGS
jgi:hypothetical protein